MTENLTSLHALYSESGPPEIIVVDDGSPVHFVYDRDVGPVRGIRLPSKEHALNPCVPFNCGVAVARGEVIVITNPEVIHRAPILAEMLDQLEALGPKGHVASACWSPRRQWWFCHSSLMPKPSSVGRAPMPPGAGLHFCVMLYRKFYEEIGGFSEEYRDGQGYEDNDFLWKLATAGAEFVIRDDLVTEHIDCPPTVWPKGGADRNRKIFEAKWPNL